jgi:hypothetical protein
LAGFLGLIMVGNSAAPKRIDTQSFSKNTFKANFLIDRENKNSGQGLYYIVINHPRAFFSITTSFLSPATSISTSAFYISGEVVAIPGRNRAIRDHFLHLFPFHCFW